MHSYTRSLYPINKIKLNIGIVTMTTERSPNITLFLNIKYCIKRKNVLDFGSGHFSIFLSTVINLFNRFIKKYLFFFIRLYTITAEGFFLIISIDWLYNIYLSKWPCCSCLYYDRYTILQVDTWTSTNIHFLVLYYVCSYVQYILL